MNRTYSVLFVDDEENILNSLRRGMIDEDYTCYFASSGEQALRILGKERISVLVTDMRMPEMDGLALLKEVKLRSPSTVRIVLSGYAQLQQVLTTINQVDIFKFITKPWKLEEEFKKIIRQAVEYYRLHQEHEELELALQNKNTAYQKILKNIEQIIAEAKNSAEGVKTIGSRLFESLLFMADSEADPDDVKHQIHRAGRIFDAFATSCSEQVHEFELEQFFKELWQYAGSLPGVTSLEFKSAIQGKVTVRGKPELIRLMFMVLWEIMIGKQDACNIKAVSGGLQAEPSGGTSLELSMLVTYASLHRDTKDLRKTFRQIDLDIELISAAFGALLHHQGGSFSCGRSDSDFITKITFRFS